MTARLLCLFIVLWAPSAWGQAPGPGSGTLVVQVRSDMRPGTEFKRIRTEVFAPGGGPAIVTRNKLATRGDAYDQGVRVAEIRLANARYRVMVSALTTTNQVVVQRPVRVQMKGGVNVVTVLLTKPTPQVAPGDCQNLWNREKRTCGKVLAACIKGAGGARARIDSCSSANQVCVRSADRKRAQCESKGAGAAKGLLAPRPSAPDGF